MKTNMFLICLLSFSFVACSNSIPETDVPSVVLNSFKSEFSNALNIEWERNNKNYEADFSLENVEHHVQFSAEGVKLRQKREITLTELPTAIDSALKSKFPNYLADEIELLIQNGVSYYQIELESKGKADKKLVFAANGVETNTVKYWD